MPRSVQQKVTLGFLTALLVLLAVGGIAYQGVRQTQDRAIAERTSAVRLSAVSRVIETVADAQSSLRDYFRSGDARDLGNYQHYAAALPAFVITLQQTANPLDSGRVVRLAPLVLRAADTLASILATHDRSGRETVTSIDPAIIDSVRREGAALREVVFDRLEARQASADATGDRAGLVIMLGVLITIAITAFATSIIVRDDRIRQRDQLAVERARDAAEEASRAKSDFLARMSHELRTPLNAIIGFASVLLRNKRGTFAEQDIDYLTRIQASGTQLLTIINGLLDLSAVEAGRFDVASTPVDVIALVRETAESFAASLDGTEVSLALDIPPSLRPLKTDADKLRQVVTTLLGNAIKFTEHGRVVVRVVADGSGTRPWRLDVVDEGTGVAASRQGAIFGAFEQGENAISRRFGGSGIGLAISKSICERLGFGLTVVSQEGRGSTFSILFDSAAKPPQKHERVSGSIPIVGPIDDGIAIVTAEEREFDVGPALPWNSRVSGR